jgi:hypothetical protein
VSLDDLIRSARALAKRIDEIVEACADDLEAQGRADWAWYRLRTVLDLAIQRGAGPTAAALARSLLEEAAYWDWAIASGAATQHLAWRAASEYAGLVRLASETGDDLWLRWLLPPGTTISAEPDALTPRNAGEVVNRLGSGLAPPVLGSLRFRGLFAANQLLDVLTHGNVAAALVMSGGGGDELPEPLAAAVVHVAAAGATAVVTSCLDASAEETHEVSLLALAVAEQASAIHGLPRRETPISRRPPRAQRGHRLLVTSDIERMPQAAETTTAAALLYIESATALTHAAVERLRQHDASAHLAWTCFQLSWSAMLLFQGVARGKVGRACLPFAARSLLEDGARWEWMRQQARLNPNGHSFGAIVANGNRYLRRVRHTMESDGIPPSTVDRLLGHAAEIGGTDVSMHRLPPIKDLLQVAYPNNSDLDSARIMYSVLSQFSHATPLAQLHLQPDEQTSLTAPTYAIAVEAACRGFWNIARATLTIACEQDASLDGAFGALGSALSAVRHDAAFFHVLG